MSSIAAKPVSASPQPVDLQARAIVLPAPGELRVQDLPLDAPGPQDVVVDVEWSGISTGTERLLWTGDMPSFPGMGYPLVPGYESVGRIVAAGPESGRSVGERVFVPGARCFGEVRGLFGGAASRLVLPGPRVRGVPDGLGADAALLALAATAWHAVDMALPELIVGHGVLGRLIARLAVLRGGAPVVWESDPRRRTGGTGYAVTTADDDPRKDYRSICDVSGDAGLLDPLIARLAHRGALVLAGFYSERLAFDFAPAFMREAQIRIAAEWRPTDLDAAAAAAAAGELDLSGLVTHRSRVEDAQAAYRIAFSDPDCLKMVLDWSSKQ